tara:strand:- start:1495 stop:2004 length:510 start_codon:yes stop_codon:yes gene_type:complete
MAKKKSSKSKKQNSKYLIKLTLELLPFIIYGLMLKYINDIEKKEGCGCAVNNDLKLIKKLLIAWFINNGVLLILSFYNDEVSTIAKLLLLLAQVGIFIYVSIVFFRYNNKLNNSGCKCSKGILKSMFKYYLYFTYAVILVQLLLRSMLYNVCMNRLNSLGSARVVKINL